MKINWRYLAVAAAALVLIGVVILALILAPGKENSGPRVIGIFMNDEETEQEKKTAAILMVQNAAELLKGASGDFSAIESQLGGSGTEQVWQVPMDQNWDAVPKLEQATYLLLIEKTSATAPYLGMASVQLQCRGETLVEITVAWQEDM